MTHSPDGASAGGLRCDCGLAPPDCHPDCPHGGLRRDILTLSAFQRHYVLRMYDSSGHVLPEALAASQALDRVLRALSPSPGLGEEGVHLAPNVRGQEPRSSVLTSTPCQSEWRPEVRAFADLMETKLRKNDHKPGWKRDSAWDLLRRLVEETEEIRQAARYAEEYDTSDRGARLNPWLPVAHEAADVANFAMMIADVCGALSSEAPSPKSEVEPIDTPLPCDVTVAHITFRKGVKLSTFVDAAARWHERASWAAKPEPEKLAEFKAWFERRVELEGDCEIGAGLSVGPDPAESGAGSPSEASASAPATDDLIPPGFVVAPREVVEALKPFSEAAEWMGWEMLDDKHWINCIPLNRPNGPVLSARDFRRAARVLAALPPPGGGKGTDSTERAAAGPSACAAGEAPSQSEKDTLLDICDRLQDEGDRVYLGSTNDADALRALGRRVWAVMQP